MNKQKKNKLVPMLRFPEFVNTGEWEYLNGDEIFEPISNKNHNSDLPILAITQEQGAIPRDMIDYHVSVSNKSVEGYKVVEVGDFIISLRSFQGGIEYSNYNGLCSPAYIILRKKVNIENDFYRHYFKSKPFIRDLNKNLEGLRDGKMISYNQFSEIILPKPNSKEQKKIASCLSSLDELISDENQKLDALQDSKNGLMQLLFPVEGEKAPKQRFKEFRNDEEWVSESFSDLYRLISTNSYSRDQLNYDNGHVKNIHYGDIHKKFSTLFDITKESVPFINSIISLDNLNEDCYCIESDIVFADASEDLKDVGKSIEIVNINGEKLLAGMHTIHARQRTPKLDVGFGGYLFLSNKIRENIQREAQGAKVLGISGYRLANMKIYYPENKKEQQKITSCLSSLDELISAQREKVEALKEQKRGLTQGLFTNLNQISK